MNYMSQILVELVKLANLVVLLTRAIASMGRVSQVLDTPSTMAFPEKPFRRMLLPMWRWRSTMCPCAIRARVRKACPM